MDRVDYFDTFIGVAPDSSAVSGEVPPPRTGGPTVAALTFDMVREHPYEYTSGDVIFTVMADRKAIPDDERAAARRAFYSRGQACLRSSDLGKRYGWGIHSDAEGRVALYGIDSPEYEGFITGVNPSGGTVAVTYAMRGSRTR